MTLYDFTTRTAPERHAADNIAAWESYFAGAQAARAFVAISEYTRQEAIEQLGIMPEQITVTPLAPRAHTRRITDTKLLRSMLAPHGLDDRPFVLYAGTLEPRKNVTTLVAAFAQALRQGIPSDTLLVLAGGHWPGYDTVVWNAAQDAGISDHVQMLGYVEDTLMNALMSSCTAFAYLSLGEGFGMPPLEAMTCGAPVVVSNVTSLPEVVGPAGFQVAPDATDAAAEALYLLLTDSSVNRVQKEHSEKQAARFSWAHTAKQTSQVYRSVVGTT